MIDLKKLKYKTAKALYYETAHSFQTWMFKRGYSNRAPRPFLKRKSTPIHILKKCLIRQRILLRKHGYIENSLIIQNYEIIMLKPLREKIIKL